VSPLCGAPGRYEYIRTLGGVDGGTVRIFYFLLLCSGGYGTIEMVKGFVRVSSLLSSVCCQFSWRVDMCGRNIVLYFLLVIL
jgi:hypothetical protein